MIFVTALMLTAYLTRWQTNQTESKCWEELRFDESGQKRTEGNHAPAGSL